MFRAGIQRQQLGGELAEHVIGDNKHRLAGKNQAPRFHRSGNHRVSFFPRQRRGPAMCSVFVESRQTRLLVRWKLNCTARAGQGQVIAVKRANARVIERVVVEAAKPFSSRIVRTKPHSLNRL